jgi:hypothetical protein
MTPALLISMCRGLSPQAWANRATEARSDRSTIPTLARSAPTEALMSAQAFSPASRLRTASMTSAPAPARARAVSIPIPVAPPVTMAARPDRSWPCATTAASV